MIVTIVSGGIFLSFTSEEQYHSNMISRAQDVNANSIMIHARAHLVPEDFTVGNYEQKKKVFSEFFDSIDTSEIVRIKVWSKDGIILFSDNKEIVGKDFSDNPNFLKAIKGSIIPVIKEHEKPENIAEKGYGQLMEQYIPIILGHEIVGVIELYTSLDLLNNSVDETHQIIFIVTVTVILFVISIILVSGYHLERSIVTPIKKLRESTREISRGNFDVNLNLACTDEINELAEDVNKMADELSKNQSELIKDERLKSIGELSSRLAHDLRNPLSSIKLSAKIIEQKAAKKGDTEYQKNLYAIDRSIGRMMYQLESVLDYIKIKPLDIQQVTIYDMIKRTFESVLVPEKIKIDIEQSDVKINCDIQRLGIVFTNLITNSIQAIGNKTGKITVRIQDYKDKISIKVIDSGSGVPNDKIDKVFEPLYTTKQVGTGLGLSSVQNIVKQHNGTITVQNNPTTFTVMLPKIITIQEVRN